MRVRVRGEESVRARKIVTPRVGDTAVGGKETKEGKEKSTLG